MPRPFACALLVSLALLAPPARAQPAPTVAPETPLLVDDAIALALRKSYNLQLQNITTEQAKETLNGATATFDPTITAAVNRSVSQSASTTSRLEGTTAEGPRSDATTTSVGVSEHLAPTNGTISLATNVTRSATNSDNALINPSFGNGFSASLSQPLLQNAGRKVAVANIERAKLGIDIANITYKSQVLTTIASVENAYYNLVTARETLRIRQLSLDLAQKLFDENTTRRTTGVMTDLDVLSAEAGVANARRGVIEADQGVRDAEDALLVLINVEDFDVRPGPVKFDDYVEGPPNFAGSYKLARDFYPDNLSAEDTLKQLQISLDVARRNLRPSLNLNASLGYTARSTSNGYYDVLANLPNDHGNNWSLGLSYSMPWGQHADKANFRTAKLNVDAQKIRIDQLEQQLLINVRAAVRSVETNLQAVDVAAKSTELFVKQYEAQKARFDAGLSTSRAVLQAQDDLENARFNELGAKLTLRRAATELHRLEGSSLQHYRVALP